MSDGPLLEVRGLVKHFRADRAWFKSVGAVRAVDDVSFSIDPGTALALVGESGSGKTTLGRVILRLIDPTGGSVSFDGTDVLGLKPAPLRAFRRRMQIVFQDPAGSLNPRMRVGTAVREPIEVHRLAKGNAAKDRVASLFTEVGLDPDLMDRYPHELSGGQKQRVGIARALSVEPEFMVLDEPVSALDVSVQAQVLNLLADLQRARGLTYLFIAHDLAVVRHVADRVAVMYLGKIVEEGPIDDMYVAPRHPYTTALLSAAPIPDPASQRQRMVLRGELPSPRNPPKGCAFHTRCPHPKKDARCTSDRPQLVEVGSNRMAACHYSDDPMKSG